MEETNEATTEVVEQSQDDSPESPAESPRTFTQDEVGRLLAAERKKVEAKLAQAEPKPVKSTKSTARKSEADRELESRMERMELLLNYKDAVADYSLNGKQRSRLERAFLAEAPDDAHSWIKEAVADLGLSQQPQAGTSEQPSRPAVPVQRNTAPGHEPDSHRTENPLLWDRSRIERIMDSGKTAIEGSYELRKRWQEGMAGVVLEMPRGK